MLSSFTFSENTIGFLIDGELNETTVTDLHNQILDKLNTFNTINLYLEDNGIEEFKLPMVIEEIMFKIKHSDRFNKVAIVSDRKWIQLCASIENLFLPSTIKNFDVEDRLDAINWIAS